ncbi:hypothetical protein J4468_02050 [Candidatus Woesearchaeota archaeon]|nr:hypothetical protein [Candidatus Woesearchaeota archaeon]
MKLKNIALLAIVASMFSCVNIKLKDEIYFSVKEVPKYTHQLRVNLDDCCYYIVKQDERKGIIDLSALVNKESCAFFNKGFDEEAFAFLPKKNLWIETGVEHMNYVNVRGMSTNLELYKKIINENDQIFMYHFHPDDPALMNSLMSFGEKFFGNNAKKIWQMGIAFPSRSDLTAMLGFLYNFLNVHPDGIFKCKIASPFGVMEYYPTELGRKLIVKRDYVKLNFSTDEIRFILVGENYIGRNELDCIKKTCENASNEYIKLEFKGYEEIFN